MKVIFSDRAYIQLLSETNEKISTETGGLFLGMYQDNVWYIAETIDPGPQSIFKPAYFEYDQKYTQHLINKVARVYKKRLTLIGLWHRHPGSFDIFSSTDDGTNTLYAKMHEYGAISALVNIDLHFRLTMYHVSLPLGYKKIDYEVGDWLFPEGILELKTVSDYPVLHIEEEGNCNKGDDDPHKNILAEFIHKMIPAMYSCLINEEIDLSDMDKDVSADEFVNAAGEDVFFLTDELGLHLMTSISDGLFILHDTSEKLGFFRYKGEFVMNCRNCFYSYRIGFLKQCSKKTCEAINAKNGVQSVGNGLLREFSSAVNNLIFGDKRGRNQ